MLRQALLNSGPALSSALLSVLVRDGYVTHHLSSDLTPGTTTRTIVTGARRWPNVRFHPDPDRWKSERRSGSTSWHDDRRDVRRRYPRSERRQHQGLQFPTRRHRRTCSAATSDFRGASTGGDFRRREHHRGRTRPCLRIQHRVREPLRRDPLLRLGERHRSHRNRSSRSEQTGSLASASSTTRT